MDQTMVPVVGEVKEVTLAGNLIGETLSTHRSP